MRPLHGVGACAGAGGGIAATDGRRLGSRRGTCSFRNRRRGRRSGRRWRRNGGIRGRAGSVVVDGSGDVAAEFGGRGTGAAGAAAVSAGGVTAWESLFAFCRRLLAMSRASRGCCGRAWFSVRYCRRRRKSKWFHGPDQSNGVTAILKGILSLCRAACQQECGNGQQPLHHDLLTQLKSPARAYAAANLHNVIYITLKI